MSNGEAQNPHGKQRDVDIQLADGVRGYAHIERRGDVATLACSLVIDPPVPAGTPIGFVPAALRPAQLIHVPQGLPPDPPTHYCTIRDDGAILLSRYSHLGETVGASWALALAT